MRGAGSVLPQRDLAQHVPGARVNCGLAQPETRARKIREFVAMLARGRDDISVTARLLYVMRQIVSI